MLYIKEDPLSPSSKNLLTLRLLVPHFEKSKVGGWYCISTLQGWVRPKTIFPLQWRINEKFCAIWYNFHNSKNVINTHGEMLLLVNLQASACNFIESNSPLWVFCTYFILCLLYQIAQSITNNIYTKWTILSGDCKILLSQDKSLPQLNHWSYMPSPSIIFKHTLTPPLFEDSWGDELQVHNIAQ